MKRAGTVFGLVLLLIALATANASAPSELRPKFGTNGLQGIYGMSHEVGVVAGRQFAELALLDFDGKGGCEFTLIPNGVGINLAREGSTSCSYEVAKDGVGFADITTEDGVSFALTFVLVNGGKAFRYMFTAPEGFQGIGEGFKQ